METSNKFFVKFEDGAHQGRAHVSFATHVPKIISPEDALNLAAHLIKAAGGEKPYEAFEPYAKAIIGE